MWDCECGDTPTLRFDDAMHQNNYYEIIILQLMLLLLIQKIIVDSTLASRKVSRERHSFLDLFGHPRAKEIEKELTCRGAVSVHVFVI